MSDQSNAREIEQARVLGEVAADVRNIGARITEQSAKVDDASRRIEKRLDEMSAAFVTKVAFTPVRLIAYGVVGVVATIVTAILVAQIIRVFAG